MAHPDARQAAALDIARHRKIRFRWLADGGVLPVTAAGEAIGTTVYPDPVEALEEAEKTILAGERREAEVRSSRLLSALQRGVYAPWPQLKKATGPRAEGEIVEWTVLRVLDRSQVGQPFPGLIGALVEIARLVGEPVEVE